MLKSGHFGQKVVSYMFRLIKAQLFYISFYTN